MIPDWQSACVRKDATIRDALRAIEAGHIQIAFVVTSDGVLQGAVTDGDIRRALLAGTDLEASVTAVMRRDVTTAPVGTARVERVERMQQRGVRQIPVVDASNRVIGIELLAGSLRAPERPNEAVLMVGGLGTRLRELTAETPKPLLTVGRKPLLETIIERLEQHGIRRFRMAVNYRADMIMDYFGDGSEWDVNISYVRERERMGTAGALSLLDTRPASPFLVMNGDVLTTLDFTGLLDHHYSEDVAATVAVREYPMQVPFGVVHISKGSVVDLVEKPTFTHYVSAGIYVLDPRCLDYVRPNESLDMPDLLRRIVATGERATSYEVHEYWRDVGRPSDLHAANDEFDDHFAIANDDA